MLSRSSFYGQSLGDAGKALTGYWGGSLGVKGGSCPVGKINATKDGAVCSGRGVCDLADFSCKCDNGFAGFFCSKEAVPGIPFTEGGISVRTYSNTQTSGNILFGNKTYYRS